MKQHILIKCYCNSNLFNDLIEIVYKLKIDIVDKDYRETEKLLFLYCDNKEIKLIKEITKIFLVNNKLDKENIYVVV